jgi:Arc/MetJ family transcription regulator
MIMRFVCWSEFNIGDYMHISIVIDDELMANAFKATGLKTKKDVIEQGLRLLIKRKEQQAIRVLRGKLKWEGNLDDMRRARQYKKVNKKQLT